MAEIRLRLENIAKRFAHQEVLTGLNLTVKRGEIRALLGDNGAGKSTLIKIIAGYHAPDSGIMLWNGEAIDFRSYDPQAARRLGIQTVYQHLGLVDQLSIARNFFLGLEPTKGLGPLRWLDRAHMHNVVTQQLMAMGIKRALHPDDPVEKLSGGERQAIAIARARFFGAKLLILDEPTSALSLRQTNEVLHYIKQAAKLGIAVIFITHTLHHVQQIVDRITILHHGRAVGDFSAGEISTNDCAQLITHGQIN